jgi:DMSO/TMAO reductase YedYZ molybdopterin-dependent catalytic subunit
MNDSMTLFRGCTVRRAGGSLLLVAVLCVGCLTGSPADTPEGAEKHATPALTPIEDLGITGEPIEVDIASYRLVVEGLVSKPLSLSYTQLLAYPTVTQVPRLDCPGFFVDYAEWTGPLVRTLLEQAGVQPQASKVTFYDASDFPYRATLSLEEALRDDTYLAHTLYGEPLPAEHGYPLRLVVGTKPGNTWVKWLFRINVE